MEKEGLCKGIEFLSANALNINILVTDRHNQISKFVSKEHPSIEHCYDIWHVSKGMNTDTKACEKLYDIICNARLLEDIKKLSPIQ